MGVVQYVVPREELMNKTMALAEKLATKGPISIAATKEIMAAARQAHAHSFIKRLPQGYDTVIGESGGNLSQGQKQLLCIARVMLCLPPMLFLTFRSLYDISYSLLGLLVLANFATQLTVDLILSFFSHKFSLPKLIRITPAVYLLGLVIFMLSPVLFPGNVYLGLVIGTVTTVMTEAGGQSTYGVIEPACDVDGLSQVFVIKDFTIVE